MQHPVQDYLSSLVDRLRAERGGELATYIPVLAEADPERLGVAMATVTGRVHCAGDADTEFTIQSVSKPFAYAAALVDRGAENVDAAVGLNPSGEAFNELSLEEQSKRPDNAMINAGALAVHQLLVGPFAGRQERIDRVVGLMSLLAGRRLTVDRTTYESEMGASDRNFALAHMLRSHGILHDRAEDVVAGYVAQCSVLVTVRDLAVMGACLASGGVHPLTGERVLPSLVCRQVLSLMSSAGMYEAAGQWMAHVGIPAKSGVSGAVLGALPGQAGIAVFSPPLDAAGNSVRGVLAFERMSEDLNLHIMEADALGGTVVRFVRREGDTVLMHLQGVIRFGGAEAVATAMADLGTGDEPVAGDWQTPAYPEWEHEVLRAVDGVAAEHGDRVPREDEDPALAVAAATGDGSVPEAAAAREEEGSLRTVVLNLERVDRMTRVGRHLVSEGIRRLQGDGVEVQVVDPDGMLGVA